MASAHDQDDVDIIEEVEDVMQELMKIFNRPLHDEIDMNDIYHVLETIINSGSSTKTQRLMKTVEIMQAKVRNIKKCELKKSSSTSCDDIFDDTSDLDNDEENEEIIGDTDYWKPSEKKHFNALILLYPDVDRLTLKNKIEEFGRDSAGLESWLASNLEQLPERKQVLALARLQLTNGAEMNDKTLSQCPSCDSCKMVEKGEVTECDEIGCRIIYCLLCHREDHRPFHCRKDDDIFRLRTAKDTNDIFKPLMELPTTQRDGLKRFVMFPKNDMDWSNPKDILYMTAEASFLRMVERSNAKVTRRSIQSIDYIENQEITAKFLTKQNNFLAKNINCKERLCFYGTSITNVDHFLKKDFMDKMMKRCAYGRGHYFSEFPDVKVGYGPGLLLCRVLVGKSWKDSSDSNIPQEFNSKIVEAVKEERGWAIVIPDSRQILPTFLIKLNRRSPN